MYFDFASLGQESFLLKHAIDVSARVSVSVPSGIAHACVFIVLRSFCLFLGQINFFSRVYRCRCAGGGIIERVHERIIVKWKTLGEKR